MSKIEWTEKTWNPIVGCSKVSAGCKNCYAISMAWRLQHIQHSKEKYAGTVEKTAGGQLNWTGKVNIIEKEFIKPFTWKKPSMVFVNSESDLFHESIPYGTIRDLFGVMSVCKEHTFQVLTKRPQRMVEFFKWFEESDPDFQDDPAHEAYDLCDAYGIETGCGTAFETEAWPLKNVCLGVSVENQQTANERIPLLLQVPAAVRFLSCEPLLGPISLDSIDTEITCPESKYCRIRPLTGIQTDMGRPCPDTPKLDWIIVGGESGHGARPLHPDWVRSLRDQCQKAGTAFFFKQWGEYYTKSILLGSGAPTFRMFDSMQHWINKAQTWVRGGRCISIDGRECHIGKDFQECAYPVAIMDKVGKKKSGRMLDGREWNEFPGKQPVVADDPDLHTPGFDY